MVVAMPRPAESSAALLIRRPEERRCREVASCDWVLLRLRCAFSDEMLLLIEIAMGCFLLELCVGILALDYDIDPLTDNFNNYYGTT